MKLNNFFLINKISHYDLEFDNIFSNLSTPKKMAVWIPMMKINSW